MNHLMGFISERSAIQDVTLLINRCRRESILIRRRAMHRAGRSTQTSLVYVWMISFACELRSTVTIKSWLVLEPRGEWDVLNGGTGLQYRAATHVMQHSRGRTEDLCRRFETRSCNNYLVVKLIMAGIHLASNGGKDFLHRLQKQTVAGEFITGC